jgi:hypothetical protein
MKLRFVLALAALAPALPATAGEMMKPQQAHQFVAGKYFAYNCFEGTSGSGRIQADGSVAGVVRIKGKGPARFVQLPPGTIKVSSNSICAQVRGMSMQPCFNVEQIDANSFRGSVAGLGFAYCTFTRRNPRLQLAELGEGGLPSRPAASIRRAHHPVRSAEMSIDAPVPAEVGKVEKSDIPPAVAAPEELKLRPSKSE